MIAASDFGPRRLPVWRSPSCSSRLANAQLSIFQALTIAALQNLQCCNAANDLPY
jgi:hypothetical protein